MADVSKGWGGGGGGVEVGLRRNVRLTFLVEQIDMCDFPKIKIFLCCTVLFYSQHVYQYLSSPHDISLKQVGWY